MITLISPGHSVSEPASSDTPRHASHPAAWCRSLIPDAYDLTHVLDDHSLAFSRASFSLFCVPHNLSESAFPPFRADTDHAAFSTSPRYVRHRVSSSAGSMEPQDLAVTVTEDRRRGTIARLLGRGRTPSPRFFKARVNSQNVAAIAWAMTNYRAMSPDHLDEAQSGDNDDSGDFPGHNVTGERSQMAISEASGESPTSPVVTNVPYPPTDSASRSNTASHTPPPIAQTDTDDTSDISSESDIESHSSPSGSTGSSVLTLTASSPLSTFSIIRHSRVTQPLQSPATQAARFRGYLEDPGPSTGRSWTYADGGDHRPSNVTTDPTGTPIGQQRLNSISEDDSSSQEEVASQPPPPTEPASPVHDCEASGSAQAANQHGHKDDLTYLSFEVQKVNHGPFVDHRLLIRVGKRSQLGDPRAEPFAQRLDDVFEVCVASQFAFMELFLDVHESTVRGGGLERKDAFIQVLLRLVPHLRNLRSASVKFRDDVGEETSGNLYAQERQLIRSALPSLRHVQLEGKTKPERLHVFPLGQLRVLEVLTEVTENTVEGLASSCCKFGTLTAGPVVPDITRRDFSEVFANSNANATIFPSFLRIFSAHPCKELLAAVSRGAVEVDFTLTNAQWLSDVRGLLSGNPASVIRIA
ncbi:hypothetical protein FB107DRAFT_224107 [Schizophyllum commune]